jgi:hypothetical protein
VLSAIATEVIPRHFNITYIRKKDNNGKWVNYQPAAAGSMENVKYHSWPLLYNVKVNLIFWGSNQSNQILDEKWYRDIVTTNFLTWGDAEYAAAPPQTFGTATVGSVVTITNAVLQSSKSKGLLDSKIQSELKNYLTSNRNIDRPTPNSYYALHFSKDTSWKGTGFLTSWCAYHSFMDYYDSVDKKWYYKVPYGVIPDNAPYYSQGWCGSSYGWKTSYMSHEYLEAVTDPNWNVAVTPNLGGWWGDVSGYEIADNCAWVMCDRVINGTTWTLQQMWSNLRGCECPI